MAGGEQCDGPHHAAGLQEVEEDSYKSTNDPHTVPSEVAESQPKPCQSGPAYDQLPLQKQGSAFITYVLDTRRGNPHRRVWVDNEPLRNSLQYLFEETARLLKTEDFNVIQLRYNANNIDELSCELTRGEVTEFERSKPKIRGALEEFLLTGRCNREGIKLFIEPLGLQEETSTEPMPVRTDQMVPEEVSKVMKLLE